MKIKVMVIENNEISKKLNKAKLSLDKIEKTRKLYKGLGVISIFKRFAVERRVNEMKKKTEEIEILLLKGEVNEANLLIDSNIRCLLELKKKLG